MRRIYVIISFVLLPLFLFSGCGSQKKVTYVDPNPPSAYSNMQTSVVNPIEKFNTYTTLLASSVLRLYGSLGIAEQVADTNPELARKIIAFAIKDSFEEIEPQLYPTQATYAEKVRQNLESLSSNTQLSAEQLSEGIKLFSRSELGKIRAYVIPNQAEQNIQFRAAVLSTSLQTASTDLDAVNSSETQIEAIQQLWRAGAVIVFARTYALNDIPKSAQQDIQDKLDSLLRKLTTDWVTPPAKTESLIQSLYDLSENIDTLANIDTTFPPPTSAAPDYLRTLRSAAETTTELIERKDNAAVEKQLYGSVLSALTQAAPSIASVDGDLLITIERLVRIEMPNAIKTNGYLIPLAARLDTHIEDATALIEDELEIQREAN